MILFLALGLFPSLAWANLQAEGKSGATVVVTSEQAEADVYFDGEYVGLTPARVENVSPGPHAVRVEAGQRVGERRVSIGTADRMISVPLTGIARPLSVGIEGALGFRGSAALINAGLGFTYHLVEHEIGVAADWFNLRGSEVFRMEGIVARLQYAFVPWWISGGNDVAIRPAKFMARVNVAQTTLLEESVLGPDIAREDVAGLGAGLGVGTEVQWRGFGVEPSLYYDFFSFRSIGVNGGGEKRPVLNNGGLNLRLKYYFP
jgi:hypothetical protein